MMRRRTNGLLAIIAFLAMLLVVPALCNADQAGLGGAWVDGHSDSGDYGINNKGKQSWGVHLNYDKDLGWKKMLGKSAAIGLDPSMQLFYLHWTKTTNNQETYCDGTLYEEGDWSWCAPKYDTETYFQEREGWKTRETYETSSVDSLIMGVGPKAYLELGKFRLFGLAGLGYALQDGAQDDMAAIIQGGISYQFTKNFGLSADHSEIYVSPGSNHYDRFDVTSLNAVLFF